MKVRLEYADGSIGEFENVETMQSLETGVVYVDDIQHVKVNYVSVEG